MTFASILGICFLAMTKVEALRDVERFGYNYTWRSERGWPVAPSFVGNFQSSFVLFQDVSTLRKCGRKCKRENATGGSYGYDYNPTLCICEKAIECVELVIVQSGGTIFSSEPRPEECSDSFCDLFSTEEAMVCGQYDVEQLSSIPFLASSSPSDALSSKPQSAPSSLPSTPPSGWQRMQFPNSPPTSQPTWASPSDALSRKPSSLSSAPPSSGQNMKVPTSQPTRAATLRSMDVTTGPSTVPSSGVTSPQIGIVIVPTLTANGIGGSTPPTISPTILPSTIHFVRNPTSFPMEPLLPPTNSPTSSPTRLPMDNLSASSTDSSLDLPGGNHSSRVDNEESPLRNMTAPLPLDTATNSAISSSSTDEQVAIAPLPPLSSDYKIKELTVFTMRIAIKAPGTDLNVNAETVLKPDEEDRLIKYTEAHLTLWVRTRLNITKIGVNLEIADRRSTRFLNTRKIFSQQGPGGQKTAEFTLSRTFKGQLIYHAGNSDVVIETLRLDELTKAAFEGKTGERFLTNVTGHESEQWPGSILQFATSVDVTLSSREKDEVGSMIQYGIGDMSRQQDGNIASPTAKASNSLNGGAVAAIVLMCFTVGAMVGCVAIHVHRKRTRQEQKTFFEEICSFYHSGSEGIESSTHSSAPGYNCDQDENEDILEETRTATSFACRNADFSEVWQRFDTLRESTVEEGKNLPLADGRGGYAVENGDTDEPTNSGSAIAEQGSKEDKSIQLVKIYQNWISNQSVKNSIGKEELDISYDGSNVRDDQGSGIGLQDRSTHGDTMTSEESNTMREGNSGESSMDYYAGIGLSGASSWSNECLEKSQVTSDTLPTETERQGKICHFDAAAEATDKAIDQTQEGTRSLQSAVTDVAGNESMEEITSRRSMNIMDEFNATKESDPLAAPSPENIREDEVDESIEKNGDKDDDDAAVATLSFSDMSTLDDERLNAIMRFDQNDDDRDLGDLSSSYGSSSLEYPPTPPGDEPETSSYELESDDRADNSGRIVTAMHSYRDSREEGMHQESREEEDEVFAQVSRTEEEAVREVQKDSELQQDDGCHSRRDYETGFQLSVKGRGKKKVPRVIRRWNRAVMGANDGMSSSEEESEVDASYPRSGTDGSFTFKPSSQARTHPGGRDGYDYYQT